jgi:hypothetical protein
MAAPYEAPPLHVPPAELAAWLDSLTEKQRAALMLSSAAYAKARPKWHTLTPEEKAKVYLTEPAGSFGTCDLSDRHIEPQIATLHAADLAPQRPDDAAMDHEETAGVGMDHPHVVELANQRAARVIFEVIDWLLGYGDADLSRLNLHRRLDAADTKLISLAWMLGVREFGRVPLTQLAREMGLTRAALSHSALQVRDKWGLYSRGQRCDDAREAYSARQREIWKNRPRQASGHLVKDGQKRKTIADFLAENPEATVEQVHAHVGGAARTVHRLFAAWHAARPQPTSAPCRDESFDTAGAA